MEEAWRSGKAVWETDELLRCGMGALTCSVAVEVRWARLGQTGSLVSLVK